MSFYSSGYQPDPGNALEVLAFLLCPAEVFAPGGDAQEVEAIAVLMLPCKEAALRGFTEARATRERC